MKKVFTSLDNLGLTLNIEDVIVEEQIMMELGIAVRVITNGFVNPDALLRVF